MSKSFYYNNETDTSLCVLIVLYEYNRILTITEVKSSRVSFDLIIKYCVYEIELN